MVKEGYKQTEVGVIPEDWRLLNLSELASIKTGPFGSALHADDYVISGTPIITVEHLGEYSITNQNLPMVSEKDRIRLSNYTLVQGDIVFSRVGSVDRNSYITSKEDGWLFSGRLLRIRIKNEKCFPLYLSFYFKSETVKQRIRDIAVGQTMPSLNTKLLLTFQVLIPPIIEQKRIAEALSDIDELISSLEKLIAKKKAIKQGAMRQLLTGKTRLPGNTDKWNQNTFGELFEILPNNAYTRDQLSIDGTIKNIHYGDILTKYGAVLDGKSKTIPTLAPDLEKKKRPESQFVHNGDIIIADTAEDETVGKAVELYNVNCKILSGQHTFFCHPKIEFAPMFLGYYLNSTEFHAQMLPYITGTKVSSISKQSLNMLVIWYPSKEEQEAIAKILYEMDCEIEALGKKLEKVVQNKQGMMQQLLTGKIRLT